MVPGPGHRGRHHRVHAQARREGDPRLRRVAGPEADQRRRWRSAASGAKPRGAARSRGRKKDKCIDWFACMTDLAVISSSIRNRSSYARLRVSTSARSPSRARPRARDRDADRRRRSSARSDHDHRPLKAFSSSCSCSPSATASGRSSCAASPRTACRRRCSRWSSACSACSSPCLIAQDRRLRPRLRGRTLLGLADDLGRDGPLDRRHQPAGLPPDKPRRCIDCDAGRLRRHLHLRHHRLGDRHRRDRSEAAGHRSRRRLQGLRGEARRRQEGAGRCRHGLAPLERARLPRARGRQGRRHDARREAEALVPERGSSSCASDAAADHGCDRGHRPPGRATSWRSPVRAKCW